MSLKGKSLNSLYWSLLDSFGAYFIRFGFTVSIARVLEPSDYGIMGMIVIFIGLGTLLTEGGFSMALIQKNDITDVDYSTVFHFNLVISIIVYLVLFFFANTIAEFYNEHILINVIRVSAVSIVIGALGIPHIAMLSKELNFKKQTYISWIATFGSGFTGIFMAYNGYSIWALVYMTLSYTTIKTCALWLSSGWRPHFAFNWNSFNSLFQYGWKIFISGFSDLFFNKLYYPVIARSFSSNQLGFYTNAVSFSEIIVKQISNAIGRVSFPLFCLLKSDMAVLVRTFSTVFHVILFLMSIISITAIISVHSFVLMILTPKWAPIVPYIKLFLLEGFFFALYLNCQQTISALGLSGLLLKLEIIKKLLVFLSLLALLKYGISALIIGQVLSSFITFLISIYYCQKQLNIQMASFLVEILKITFICLLIYGIDQYIIEFYFQSTQLLLLVKVLFLPIVFILLSFLMKSQGLKYAWNLFRDYFPNGSKY